MVEEKNSASLYNQFDPALHNENLLQSFNEFFSSFDYSYAAIAKDPPSNISEEEKVAWIDTNKRKIFLGRFSTRNLQKEYEEVTTETERCTLGFKDMLSKFRTRFNLSSNHTLANYKFRQITQNVDESFDQFVIRTKKESLSCNFKCQSVNCNVNDIMIRDQIILGTKDDDIRRTALHEQWNLNDLIAKGRSLEAATAGAEKIKPDIKRESEVYRTNPKKYSRKFKSKNNSSASTNSKCQSCSNPKCRGDKECPGRKVTCFKCNKKGHFQGAAVCKQNKKSTRRTEDDQSSSDVDSPPQTDDSDDERDSSITKSRRVLVKKHIVCRIKGGVRKTSKARKQKFSRYEVQVAINSQYIKAYADTGADICVMSHETAKQLKLPLIKTKMRIRPYGSKSKPCKGLYVGTIMFEDQVTNAKIYVLKDNVETLLSGKVCEDLGIIKLNENIIRKANQEEDPHKEKLLKAFPELFQGIGLLKDYKATFHVDPDVKPVAEPQRPIPFHLRNKWKEAVEKLEVQDLVEEHTGPSPWVSNLYLAPKDDGSLRATLDMRGPNKAIQRSETPIVRPEEVRAELSQYKIFSKLDFRSAFHQIELDEASRTMTVFNAGNRLLRFKRLVMGSTPATGILADALRPIFANLDNVHVIQDDVIVGGIDQEDHDKALWNLCKVILENGMTLNLDKCLISKRVIPWWGMLITDKGLKPDPSKVAALRFITLQMTKMKSDAIFSMYDSKS